MKSIKVILALAALAGGSVYAGGGKCEIVDACTVPFTGSVSVGYETDYIFRGVKYGEQAPWGAVGINMPLDSAVSLDLGAWYLNSTKNPVNYDELDLSAFVNFPLWIFKASVGGTWYDYPENGQRSNTEGALKLAYDIADLLTLTGFAAYDFIYDGWYLELAANKIIPLTDCLDLGLGAGISYVDNYDIFDGWNNFFARASLIYHLTKTASVSAYIGGDFPMDAIDNTQVNRLHGGASLTVTF
jgi:hypothetical protein